MSASFGNSLSNFDTSATTIDVSFIPSYSSAYILPFSVKLWLTSSVQLSASLLVLMLYPFGISIFALAVTVIFVFDHPDGLYVNFISSSVKSSNLIVLITPVSFSAFPIFFATTFICYSLFWIKPLNIYLSSSIVFNNLYSSFFSMSFI